ncbi:hypothetical protein ILUMI_16477 [Ignelater luminosus]|uniref:CHHC U11-48K-type domain-containing protein n=1 Tax=Ignelater luminosus TaxID=2038154 RepID=A0A8K0G8I5_IGNLU|nr:hypothetical protein ILUMI_16477 [Ignelater luminosus]
MKLQQSNPDPLMRCPFNGAHLVTKSRLQHHIIKCSVNYPNHFICPFNALHRFLNKEEYTQHLIDCPDAALSLPWKYSQTTKQGDLKQTPFHYGNTHSFHKEFEDWEAEYEQ